MHMHVYSGGNIGAEVDMAGRVDQVDEVGDLLRHFLRYCLVGDDCFILEKEGDGTGFHSDASFLLLLTKRLRIHHQIKQVVHVPYFSGKTSGDDAVGADQSVCKTT